MNTFTSIRIYLDRRDYVITLLLAFLFLLISFASSTELSTTKISVTSGTNTFECTVYIAYYGFPFKMIGILRPLSDIEFFWVYHSGGGLIRVFWDGLLLDFVLYFTLAFILIYLFRRFVSVRF